MMATRRSISVLYREPRRGTREARIRTIPRRSRRCVGSNNSRLKLIDGAPAGAEVNLRGNEITIEGDPAAAET